MTRTRGDAPVALGHLAPVLTAPPRQQHPPHAGPGSRATPPTRGSIAALPRRGSHMDSGRFNFWRSRAETRPRTYRQRTYIALEKQGTKRSLSLVAKRKCSS